MSKQQLERVRMERSTLKAEYKLLKKAMPADEASDKMIDVMSNKTDPFNDPANEW
eukprot:CAMPEP_0205819044 /NCGR_PEP_ID=MMETSP0206-20130828/1209_1 /ASSEMBLY_ACC=CAM_ASM_000279 /TAXON_ID=36767 /ORGANISM="Euplotes focardii, Strain TN1" /LENGTH=54 /DNA_ID=CAMNT_0053112091 /DNA_START=27 /DNA_END=188 /DNA_ORIENTATION=+